MRPDEWVTTALADDAVVADFLLRLKHPVAAALPPPPPTLTWGSRQARTTKPAAAKKDRDRDSMMMRCSPTTPLSWSCGAAASSASPSDDSSRPSDLSSRGRSKGAYTNDSIACSSANQRSKRKKTFTELQEEETLLLKERIYLKTEWETMHAALKKHEVKSENFKRIKTDDLHQQSAFRVASKSYYTDSSIFRQPKSAEASKIEYVPTSENVKMHDNHVISANSIKSEKGFVLPDLNMIPSEDDYAFDSLNGFS